MFKKILVATDFSKPSRAALLAAISLAEHGSGRIEALHVSTLGEYPFNSSDSNGFFGYKLQRTETGS